MSRGATALGAAVALAACGSGAASPPAMVPPPVVAVAPAPIPPTGPASFVLAGQLTQGGWVRGIAPAGALSLTLDGAPIPLAPDGRFFVAFDRDARPAATLAARLRDGRNVTSALAIARRAWQIEHIDTSPLPETVTSEEFRRRRAGELARIVVARARDTGAEGWRQDFIWPAAGRISGRFGSQRIYRGTPGSYHSGLDIAGGAGATYVAPADGVVILAAAAPFTLEGNLLMIDHGGGLNSAFLHCSELLVHEGERVRQGQPIGRIGSTGRATGPHLHWSLKWRDARLDPLLFVPPRP